MRIFYDFQIFSNQNYGGISRYFFDLIDSFDKKNCQVELPLKYTNNEYIKNYKPLQNIISSDYDAYNNFIHPTEFKGKGKLFNLYSKFSNPKTSYSENLSLSIKALKKGNFDLFHPTYYDPYFLEYLNKKPFILTVYDMIHELYPEYFHVGDSTTINKKILAGKAKRVIAISDNTKKDLCELYNISPEKVDVIHLCSSLDQYLPQSEKHDKDLDFPYILFTGVRNGYKNFNNFIKAATPILNDFQDLKIICTGTEFDSDELKLFSDLKISNRMLHKKPDNTLLAALYKNAGLFVFPSLYEGFGIPVLEAFACKCPIALSNSSSLTEIAEDAAIYFDPKDPESISQAIFSILSSKQLRAELIKKGENQLTKFSKSKMIQETIKSYESAIL